MLLIEDCAAVVYLKSALQVSFVNGHCGFSNDPIGALCCQTYKLRYIRPLRNKTTISKVRFCRLLGVR